MNFTQWIGKLGLEQESFEIIKLEHDYPGISLGYDSNRDIWTIAYNNKQWDQFHLIHKLGYIWLWKKHKVLEFMKKKSLKDCVIKELKSFYGTIIDAISYFTLANMDLDFKKKYLDYELKRLLHTYKGRFPPNHPILMKIQLYIFCYLKYTSLFPDFIRKDFPGTILYFLFNIENQIMEASKKDLYPLTREIFHNLREVLGKFDSIKNSNNHNDIIDYLIQICDILPYWNREYLIEQFSHYYQ